MIRWLPLSGRGNAVSYDTSMRPAFVRVRRPLSFWHEIILQAAMDLRGRQGGDDDHALLHRGVYETENRWSLKRQRQDIAAR